MVKLETVNKTVIICETTRWYRHWAKTQVQNEDSVIEIGSALGTTTAYLKERY